MARVASTEPPADASLPEIDLGHFSIGDRIPSHMSDCFGCGKDHPTGLHIQSIIAGGPKLESNFVVGEFHQGAPGLAHGGILTLACDEVLGHLMYLLKSPAVTGRLETDFLLPVPIGSVLHFKAEIVGVSGRKVYSKCEGHLNSPDGPIAIRARSLYVKVDLSHFTTSAPAEYLEKVKSDERLKRDLSVFEVNP